ncbi:hybrid sensor histidine kinase/response regulator [bacterium]|nr:MAG: hybrid sensor histidine kinase/response regulator [bacterium]
MEEKLRVLIVEDSEADEALILRVLSLGGFVVLSERVDLAGLLISALKDKEWDIVISDYMLPSFNGLDALRIVKATGLDLPFIIVSGAIGEDVAVAAMKAGAHDYIMKGALSRLCPAVRRELTEAGVRKSKAKMEAEARDLQARLIHANKMTSIGVLAAGVAHEINNPNNFIMSNASLLNEAWRDAVKVLDECRAEHGDFTLGGVPFSDMRRAVPELLSGIIEGTRRIKGIVDGLKDFSRTEAPRHDTTFDVNKAVQSAIAMLGSQIKEYTDLFNVSYGSDIALVKGSAQKVEQVVVNLLMNALQALANKGKAVNIATSYEKEANFVIIKVSDEGSGIPEEMLSRVTEPFFTTKSGVGGTGLGLSISYSIIKEFGGALEIKSSAGNGTTAVVRLPAVVLPRGGSICLP